jgi:hypothetical protein
MVNFSGCVYSKPLRFRGRCRNEMTSVLNVGVMSGNPVGNQIRRLDAALEAERKDKQVLLLALETKAPEVFAEYMRIKDEAEERAQAALRAQQLASQPQRFQSSVPRGNGGGGGGRF